MAEKFFLTFSLVMFVCMFLEVAAIKLGYERYPNLTQFCEWTIIWSFIGGIASAFFWIWS